MKMIYNLLGIILLLNLGSCEKNNDPKPEPTSDTTKQIDILFIGNSFTFYNEGVDYHLSNMIEADSTINTFTYRIEKAAVSSYTLERHWNDTSTINHLLRHTWTEVILQEQSTRPINNFNLFLEYAGKFDTLITRQQAKTMMFMTWAKKDRPQDMHLLAAAYDSVSKTLDTQLAPVGRVWEYALNHYPAITLHISDNKHPTLAGTYLTCCIFYYCLFDRNPEENTYVPAGLGTNTAENLRKAAWDYLQQNQVK
ncbi:MAG TPA: hypothetical protein VE912_20980 [Bacteroidales bacterium]|nr:hypothetical protein [Bacteroidales bacterium]